MPHAICRNAATTHAAAPPPTGGGSVAAARVCSHEILSRQSEAIQGSLPARYRPRISEPSAAQAALTAHHVGHDLWRGGCHRNALHRSWSAAASDGLYRATGCAQPDRGGARVKLLAGLAGGSQDFP